MKNVIVASFKEEANAIEAMHKLNELDSFGDITIYEQIMVRKMAYGKTEILKQDDTIGWRTFTGMGVGSLLGLLGGPVGFVIGLYSGTAIGAIADASHYDFAEDFIYKVERKIEAGTVSIIAEIEEDNEVFVDNILKPFGAVLIRSDVDLEFDKHVDEQIDEIEADIAEQNAEMKKAVGNEKKKFQVKIADLKEKRRARIAEFAAKNKQVKENFKTKVESGVAKVKADVKYEKINRIKRRIGRHKDTLSELNMQLKELQD